ncbi:hypothetical protein DXG03_005654 [Asterophora parasitica]|uniref:non-specific serine/threonine protein kinase n=1 Tax=Asterophora parasitica TaxID=117018 RepID=A0A9P7G5M2_9AGAR|nr:hypothetical protein DXG03_005654 [Asterophora parasitica]
MSATVHLPDDSYYDTITQAAVRKDEPNSSHKITLHDTEWLDLDDFDSVSSDSDSGTCFLREKMQTNTEDDTDVMIKLTFEDSEFADMQSEADFYRDSLAPYYGKGVPTFYGHYEGDCYSSWDKETLQCTFIVLEWCGEPSEPFDTFDRDFRRKLVQLAMKMHKKWNIRHGDLHHYNVLNKNGEPFIIDFERSIKHKCPPFKVDVLKGENGWKPLPGAILCQEMNSLLNEVHWWLPPMFQWYGYTRYYKPVTSIEDILNLERRSTYADVPEDELYEEAYEVWKTVESRWKEFQPGKPGPPLSFKTYEEYAAARRGRQM